MAYIPGVSSCRFLGAGVDNVNWQISSFPYAGCPLWCHIASSYSGLSSLGGAQLCYSARPSQEFNSVQLQLQLQLQAQLQAQLSTFNTSRILGYDNRSPIPTATTHAPCVSEGNSVFRWTNFHSNSRPAKPGPPLASHCMYPSSHALSGY